MSKYYSEISNSARKTNPTARGHKDTGVSAYCASWAGRIVVDVWTDEDGETERFTVYMDRHQGEGDRMRLAEGIMGNSDSVTVSGWNFKALVAHAAADNLGEAND